MKIELAGWKCSGLRCPTATINLSRNGKIPKVALIQMPNGTGKTTTLNLLFATLCGSAERWSSEQVNAFRSKSFTGSKGQFEVTLLVDGKPLSIELTLNYETGQASYKSTNPGSGGVVPRWHVPPSLNRFLTDKFLRLFIFDGEFAGKLLDGSLSEADGAIDTLCQLYMLDEISDFAKNYWKESSKNFSTKSQQGLRKLEKELKELEERHEELESAYKGAKDKRKVLVARIDELKEMIEVRLNSVKQTRKRHTHAQHELEKAKRDVIEASAFLMISLRMPHAIHPALESQLTNLRDNLDQLKLPENTSAQFFEELVNQQECICGRPIDAEAAQAIKERATRYLDADDAGFINALKRDIDQFTRKPTDPQEEAGYERVASLSEDLRQAVRRRKEAEQSVRTLKRLLIDDGDEQLEKWETERADKEKESGELEDLIRAIEDPGDPDEPNNTAHSLKLISRRIEDKNDQIAQIRGTVLLRKKTELIGKLLKASAKRAQDSIKQQLLEQCNERLLTILANDPLTIDRIDRSIRLQNQEGASAGQTLSIGYTFLMSVLNRGKNDFPLVVDSPAGPLDEGVRRRIGRLLPDLCTQFVGFTINTERPGFVDSLERNVKDIAFVTLFRKTPGTQRLMRELPTGRFSETDTAVLVEDRDYFYSFDLKDEEEEEEEKDLAV